MVNGRRCSTSPMTSAMSIPTSLVTLLLLVGPTLSQLPVQRHVGVWDTPPTLVPGTGGVVDGPLLGNGDLGVTATQGKRTNSSIALFLGKNDFWADAVDYRWGWVYMHLAAGMVELSVASETTSARPQLPFAAEQDLYSAQIRVRSGALETSSIVASNENTVLTNLTYRAPSSAANASAQVNVSVLLNLNDYWHLPKSVGSTPTQLWAVHENNYASVNPMVIGTCEIAAVFVRGTNRFNPNPNPNPSPSPSPNPNWQVCYEIRFLGGCQRHTGRVPVVAARRRQNPTMGSGTIARNPSSCSR